MHWRYGLEYVLYRTLAALVCRWPDRWLPALARGLSWLAYSVLKVRRQVVQENLQRAFPEKTASEREALAKACYRHFSLMILEFFKLAVWTPEQLKEKIQIATPDAFAQAFAQQPEGVILVSGHLGNWEPAIAFISQFYKPSAGVQKRIKNPYIDRHMASLRARWGMQVIYSRGALLPGLRALKKGRVVALLGDQDAGPGGVFVSFFGKPASSPAGIAALALRTGGPLVFGASLRLPRGKFRLEVVPIPVEKTRHLDRQALQEITQAYTRILEQYVRRYPEQYFWFHRRWKSSPPTPAPLSLAREEA